jgi:hypothetical protein
MQPGAHDDNLHNVLAKTHIPNDKLTGQPSLEINTISIADSRFGGFATR